jgi:starch-binding outer membrane protein SusE/F
MISNIKSYFSYPMNMKKTFNKVLLLSLGTAFFASCEKDLEQKTLSVPSSVPGFSSSVSSVVLTTASDNNKVVTFKFIEPDYGVSISTVNTLQFDVPADTIGAAAWGKAVEVKLTGDSTEKSFTGKNFNSLLVNQLKLATDAPSTIVVRLKSEVNKSIGGVSSVKPVYSVVTMTVTPYKAVIIYPALMIRGGNSWITPATRTDGLILTSVNFNNKYEGYIYLPNADGWGGDAFRLESTATGKFYGWGTSATTIAEGATGNLWLSPAPNYMKVNVDLDALTVSYTPVQFFISGDDNGWSTSATPMTYNPATKKWTADVSLTAGKAFAFTANGDWNITYKLNSEGNLVFAGNPVWGGNNIVATKTGVQKVTLDMSQGDGRYTYSIE